MPGRYAPPAVELPKTRQMVGTRAAEVAVDAIRHLAPTSTRVVVPCCGLGTILAVANARGLDAIGIERNRKRAEAARTFTLAGPDEDVPSDIP